MTKPTLADIKADLAKAADEYVAAQEPVLKKWAADVKSVLVRSSHLPKGKVENAVARVVLDVEHRIKELDK